MTEKISSIYPVYRTGPIGNDESIPDIIIQEISVYEIIQVSGWSDNFNTFCKDLSKILRIEIPENMSNTTVQDNMILLRVGPERLWISTTRSKEVFSKLNKHFTSEDCVVTDISHARTLLRIAGPKTQDLLSRGLAVDVSNESFIKGNMIQSHINEIPALVHRQQDDKYPAFILYVPRELSISFWEWITESARQFGCKVIDPI